MPDVIPIVEEYTMGVLYFKDSSIILSSKLNLVDPIPVTN